MAGYQVAPSDIEYAPGSSLRYSPKHERWYATHLRVLGSTATMLGFGVLHSAFERIDSGGRVRT